MRLRQWRCHQEVQLVSGTVFVIVGQKKKFSNLPYLQEQAHLAVVIVLNSYLAIETLQKGCEPDAIEVTIDIMSGV